MKTILITALIIVLGGLSISACEDHTQRTVGQQIDHALQRTKQELANAGDKIAQQTDRAVGAVKEKTATANANLAQPGPQTETGRVVSDTAITASIKTDFLKDPDLSILKIDVDTKNGVVVLNGLAENDEARVRAEKIANGVKGVKEVKNFLVTKRA
jgi:osmotically-inducible protein OsmY